MSKLVASNEIDSSRRRKTFLRTVVGPYCAKNTDVQELGLSPETCNLVGEKRIGCCDLSKRTFGSARTYQGRLPGGLTGS